MREPRVMLEGNNFPVDDGDDVSLYFNGNGEGHGEAINTTNCNKGLINELGKVITATENESPFVQQWIEQGLNNNQQVKQASQSGAIPQAANPAFGATSSAPAVIPPSEDHGGMLEPRLTLEDLELPEGFPPWSPSDKVSFDELLSRLPSPDSEWNQETPVLETNQAPNTPIGAPDFTSEGDLKRTE